MDPRILSALVSHAPALVVGAILWLLVYAARLPAVAAQWQRLPAWFRPIVPALLALGSGVAEGLLSGQPWVTCLIVQAVAALPAITHALPSPVAHLDQVILPVTVSTPVVRDVDRDTDRMG